MSADGGREWPCPKCGKPSVRDPRDGYCRICESCGHRAAFEAFTGPVADASTAKDGDPS